jgi:hypothetical protein
MLPIHPSQEVLARKDEEINRLHAELAAVHSHLQALRVATL